MISDIAFDTSYTFYHEKWSENWANYSFNVCLKWSFSVYQSLRPLIMMTYFVVVFRQSRFGARTKNSSIFIFFDTLKYLFKNRTGLTQIIFVFFVVRGLLSEYVIPQTLIASIDLRLWRGLSLEGKVIIVISWQGHTYTS